MPVGSTQDIYLYMVYFMISLKRGQTYCGIFQGGGGAKAPPAPCNKPCCIYNVYYYKAAYRP